MTFAAALLGAPLWFATAVAATPGPTTQKISVDVRGPVALVEVTRPLSPDDAAGGERLLDIALPERAALVDVEIEDGGKWRAASPTDADRATHAYVDRLASRGLVPAREPFDDATTLRVRVASDPKASVDVRYRFAALPVISEGRCRLRFPASPERVPVPADVTIKGASDVEIAGSRANRAHESTRGAWEISWAARADVEAGGPRLAGQLAWASPALAALSVEALGQPPVAPPFGVLFLVDRSRSVGLPGLAAERDLSERLLEALPPSTRFDALFFDRRVRRLFQLARPATREALGALEAELVPDRLENGTDLATALREAGALLRREANGFGPDPLLVIVTDGALPDASDGASLVRALGDTPRAALTVAAFVVRQPEDDPAPADATQALRHLAAARGGILRVVTTNDLGETAAPALAALARGGDVAEVRLVHGGPARALASHLAPGEGQTAIVSLPGPGPAEIVGTADGAEVHARLRPIAVDAAWLRALAAPAPAPINLLVANDKLVALVESPARGAPTNVVGAPRGALDRTVVRNTLALAFMPRARACYLNRTAATPAERDLTGRVRLAIDFTRGEVGDVVVQSSTLNDAGIEACLRDGAFAIEVPRTLRSDSPSTAVLNLVFRPRTPEKHETPEDAALGAQIDVVIEELHRTAPPGDETPPPDRSMIPTR